MESSNVDDIKLLKALNVILGKGVVDAATHGKSDIQRIIQINRGQPKVKLNI
jgi:hypothetical protein